MEKRITILYMVDFKSQIPSQLPEMSLTSFLCNFGGLLGMWLGLSLDGIFKQFFKLITMIDYRKYINFIKLNIIRAANHCKCKFHNSNRIKTIRVMPKNN